MRTVITLFFFALMNTSVFSQSTDSIFTKHYFDANKTKIYEAGYIVNKTREGIWKEYYEKGELHFEWFYKNGLKDGPYKCYRENGQIVATGNYTEGQLDGVVRIYDENNELFSESVWVRRNGSTTSDLKSIKYYSKNIKPDGTIETIDGKIYIWAFGEKYEMPNDTTKNIIINK